MATPSKRKTPLNKVKNGRVTKKKASSAAASSDDLAVKDEYTTSFGSSNGFEPYNPKGYNMDGFHKEQAEDMDTYDPQDEA